MVPQAPGPANPKTSTRTPFQGLAFRLKTNPRPQKPLPFAAVLKHLLERCCPVEFDEDITKQDEKDGLEDQLLFDSWIKASVDGLGFWGQGRGVYGTGTRILRNKSYRI